MASAAKQSGERPGVWREEAPGPAPAHGGLTDRQLGRQGHTMVPHPTEAGVGVIYGGRLNAPKRFKGRVVSRDLLRYRYDGAGEPGEGGDASSAISSDGLPRWNHSAVMGGGRMVVFGGASVARTAHQGTEWDVGRSGGVLCASRGDSVYLNDCAAFDFATGAWQPLGGPDEDGAAAAGVGEGEKSGPQPRPAARGGHTAVVTPDGQRMVVFGGSNHEGYLNDVWALDLAAGRWTCLVEATAGAEGNGSVPHPRNWHSAAVWSPPGEGRAPMMLVFGGYWWSPSTRKEHYSNELWAFDLAAHTWTRVHPHQQAAGAAGRAASCAPHARNRCSLSALRGAGQFLVVGGNYYENARGTDEWFNDAHLLTVAADGDLLSARWEEAQQPAAPLPLMSHHTVLPLPTVAAEAAPGGVEGEGVEGGREGQAFLVYGGEVHRKRLNRVFVLRLDA